MQLTDDEITYIELKLALGDQLKTMREKKAITPVELARLMSSSQSQVAKMESGEPSVSIDRFVKALLALGATRKCSGARASGLTSRPTREHQSGHRHFAKQSLNLLISATWI